MECTRRHLIVVIWGMLLVFVSGCMPVENNNVHVSLERSGGFAGVPTTKTFDTANLGADEAQQLRQLVKTADFSNLPEAIASPSNGSDRFQYKLTVVEHGQQHTVTVSETTVPNSLQPLIQWLSNKDERRG